MTTMDIAEILYETGELRYRYERRLDEDEAKWIRDGIFKSFYLSGKISSEGHYRDGLEEGMWCTYHENGQLASRGIYSAGQESGDWEFWDKDGNLELPQNDA
jgi:antitoxin component YwqK of YwqJK toxin-antitoxin module